MHNPRPGPPQGGGRPRDDRRPGGGGGGTGRTDDEGHRAAIRAIFGNDYINVILDPHRHGYNDFLQHVQDFVRERAGTITTHQLRNIFTRVKRARSPAELFVLRPQLAYVAGRSDKVEMRQLVVLLDDLIKNVDEARLQAFKDFYEAVIAYHKYFNPKGG